MPSKIGNHEVYIPCPDEDITDQDRITEKMVKTFKYIVEKDWDFIITN